MRSINNKYIDIYINNYVKSFRKFVTSKYTINIGGLGNFIATDDHTVEFLINSLRSYDFEIIISNGQETIDKIDVEYTCEKDVKHEHFEYRIEDLTSTINLSSKTGISIIGILIMRIVSTIICKDKIIYKAIILDLDDTVWKGTLAEEGIDTIRQNLYSEDATPFVTFMHFIRAMAKELGLYVAICSRNDIEKVQTAIDKLNEKEFPLKDQIDCIIANYNDKSENIRVIAQKLSILTSACVFIDDNQIIRDEVRQKLPEVFVPDWSNHNELITLIVTCCIFDRSELSLKSKNRKRLYEVLLHERKRNDLPKLFIKTSNDINHTEVTSLYAKSNQFKFTEKKVAYEDYKSLVFELYRNNGENLGVCSAVSYTENEQGIHILNWAISCRYFEIGLEEYILMHIFNLSERRPIMFSFSKTKFNERSISLIKKYSSGFIEKDEYLLFVPNDQLLNAISLNTNLKQYPNE